ncbi:MAG TPA: N-6 DNA methylase [bacterium]|nr:N-6 DNA methylase [bacterium]
MRAHKSQQSLSQVADAFVGSVHDLMQHALTEEDLRVGVEKILGPILAGLGIKSAPSYERLSTEARTVYQGRPDAVHGQVIIEYKRPGTFASDPAVQRAQDQLVDYMTAESAAFKTDPLGLLCRLVGVGIDGTSVFFVRYRQKANTKVATIDRSGFGRQGPYPLGPDTACTFLTYLRALSRLPLTAEHLADRFGPRSQIAQKAVSAFVDALANWRNEKVSVLFNEWRRLFGIVYGAELGPQALAPIEAVSQLYHVDKGAGVPDLLFSIHTYFALLMKLIAVELITLKESSFTASYSFQLTHTSSDQLVGQLTSMEDGGLYAKQGVTNFLEGDFFGWYLDALSPRLEEAIREVARGLSEFEPAMTAINPEPTRDLLKKLYQYLVPKDLRHKLGEYYTPDWLAELLLNETGYKGDTLQRLLDPACGSGTFIVLAIHRAKEYGLQHKEPPLETAKRIRANIWGFDLNPLAVIAARTNYLFALGDLLDVLPDLEIPIYLADSVLWPERTGQMQVNFRGGEYIKLQTSVGEFHVPAVWIRDEGSLLKRAAPLLKEMAKQDYTVGEAIARLKKEGLVFPPHEQVIGNFFKDILELEKQGKNGIWALFLKNAFAPMNAPRFDFVVGNPPWIRWGYLSREYREGTLSMWKEYGLFSLKGHAARLGGGEKDFSMLFLYTAADYYLKKGGKLGFLITQEVFKSKGAGEGFRRFKLGDREPLGVLKGHDLVSVQPFEGAANKTAAIVLRKGRETRYPVPYTVWTRKKGVGRIPTNLKLAEARPLLNRIRLSARPMGSISGSWQTISKSQKRLGVIQGENAYRAFRGASTEPYGVFWVLCEHIFSNGDLLVHNIPAKGKREVPKVQERVEADLVFPALPGRDIRRWQAIANQLIVMPQDPEKREPFPEKRMKEEWPRTYGYFTRFKDVLLSRGSRVVRELAERTAFYAMYGIGPYTVARYKTVWKRMANDLVAAVISQHKTSCGYKTVIPTDTTSFFPTNSEAEAHYLCAIINSTPVRDFIKSYSSPGRGFGAPRVMTHVGIPKFDPQDATHQKLAKLSASLHELKSKNELDGIPELEREVDDTVRVLFGIEGS